MYAQSELLSRAQKKQRKHNTTTDGADMSVQESDKLSAASPNVKKKKNRLKREDKQLPIFEHMDPNLPSEYVADTSSKHNSGQ